MSAIYKKELRSFFITPIGYVFLIVFLAVSGGIFSVTNLLATTTDTASYFSVLLITFIILIPLITMRLMSEERKTGTEQLLLTAPVSLFSMISAKFLAAYTLFAGAYLISCLNFITLYMFGNPNTWVLISSSVGVLFVGAAFIAIGLFISSLSENQFVSAVFTIASLAVFLVLSVVSESSTNAFVRTVLKWLSIYDRYYAFSAGLFDLTAILYYSSICIVFLFLSVRLYEKRRWS